MPIKITPANFNEIYTLRIRPSETAVCLGVAGQVRKVHLKSALSAHILNEDGSKYSEVLPIEVGFYFNDDGFYFHEEV